MINVLPRLTKGLVKSKSRQSGLPRQIPKVKPGTNAAGYELVLSNFHINGKRHGAKNALAKALGLKSRAVVDRWQNYGIPEKYAGPLFKLTGLRPEQIWPENFR